MNAYVRKVFPHDLTHEVSLTEKIVSDFFDNLQTVSFYKGDDENRQYSVSINNATDPRFGGDFKQLCGTLFLGDYIVIIKLKKGLFKLYTVGKEKEGFLLLGKFFHGEKDRHAIIRLNEETAKDFSPKKKQFPSQVIYYGVPGCGKSHQIQVELKKKNISEENRQLRRVVFHPDYCNADFVGQILPETKKDGGVFYRFKAGPFTKILREAYENPDKEYALIIEEINRGNASAIFGDLFQLLDRKPSNAEVETVNGNSYGPGWSDYCVENDYINAYFRGAYDSEDSAVPLPSKKLGNIIFNDNVDIRLPPNLSLYATMNTSDQNVFTLDNAFQRRWEMKQVSNDLSQESEQYKQEIGDTQVKWGDFREKINEIIMESAEESGFSSMEDKRLGGWFITPKKLQDPKETKIESEAFAEKVLKYLWDDAFKFDRQKHFGEVKTLEELVKKFKADGFNIFKDDSILSLQKDVKCEDGNEHETSEP